MWWWVRKPDFAQAGKESTEVIRTTSAPKLRKPSTTSLKKCWSCHKKSLWQEDLSVALLIKTLYWAKTRSISDHWTSCSHLAEHPSARHPPQQHSPSSWEGLGGQGPELLQNGWGCLPKKGVETPREQARVCSYCRIITCSPHLTGSETRLNGLLPWKWVTYESSQSTVIFAYFVDSESI